jgi:hypothetical protein
MLIRPLLTAGLALAVASSAAWAADTGTTKPPGDASQRPSAVRIVWPVKESASLPNRSTPSNSKSAARASAQASKAAPSSNAERTFTILYDWAPTEDSAVLSKLQAAGASQYLMVYQNVDPNAATTGKIDVSKIVADVKTRYGANPRGWGMLDYELPFDSVLQAGPSHPLYETCKAEMIKAIRAVKEAFPEVKWTYYGIPGLSYWPSGKLWAFASPAEQAAEVDRQITGYGPVLAELDWYSPCVYDVYSPELMTPAKAANHIQNEREYRIARINVVREFLRRNDLPARPIIPSVSPFFAPGGNVVENKLIPVPELVRDQIEPVLDAGADGIAIWSCGVFYIAQATMADNPNNETQKRVRQCYRTDYLRGVEPASWSTAHMKKVLAHHVGMAIARMAEVGLGRFEARTGAPISESAAPTSLVVPKGK